SPEPVRCSAGIACWDGVEEPQELLDRADRALYEAKVDGPIRRAVSPRAARAVPGAGSLTAANALDRSGDAVAAGGDVTVGIEEPPAGATAAAVSSGVRRRATPRGSGGHRWAL